MSGHKRATITARTENIRELNKTDMAKRFVEAGLNQLSQRLTQASHKKAKIETVQRENYNQELLQALAQVDQAFGQLEVETMHALEQQEADFFSQLDQYQELVETENEHRIAEINDQVHLAINDLAAHHEESLNDLEEKLDRINVDNQTRAQNAQRWIEAAQVMMDAMLEDPMMAGRNAEYLSFCSELIDQAEDNQQSGFQEAALIAAQNAYRELYKARVKLYQLRSQYFVLSNKLIQELELIEQEVNLNQQVQVFDLRGNPLESEIWVDDWVGGKLNLLKEEINSAREILGKTPSTYLVKKIRNLLQHVLPEWHARLSDYVYQARSEVINSQLRMNIALLVIKNLASQGYRLEQSQYTAEDMRLDYRAQLTDSEGSKILVQVEAMGDKPENTELNIFTQDFDKRTPHELKQRSIEIQNSLRKAGLLVGDLVPVTRARNISQERRHQGDRLKIMSIPGQVIDER